MDKLGASRFCVYWSDKVVRAEKVKEIRDKIRLTEIVELSRRKDT